LGVGPGNNRKEKHLVFITKACPADRGALHPEILTQPEGASEAYRQLPYLFKPFLNPGQGRFRGGSGCSGSRASRGVLGFGPRAAGLAPWDRREEMKAVIAEMAGNYH